MPLKCIMSQFYLRKQHCSIEILKVSDNTQLNALWISNAQVLLLFLQFNLIQCESLHRFHCPACRNGSTLNTKKKPVLNEKCNQISCWCIYTWVTTANTNHYKQFCLFNRPYVAWVGKNLPLDDRTSHTQTVNLRLNCKNVQSVLNFCMIKTLSI